MPEATPPGGLVGYFGYGSLVNPATLRTDFVEVRPARLRGFRRCWQPRPDMPGFASLLLTVRPDPEACCDGVLVVDRIGNLSAVDAREARYRRMRVEPGQLEAEIPRPLRWPVYVYQAEAVTERPDGPGVILRSYLDAVLQGFLALHGEAGVRRFVAETEGFGAALHDDRDEPIYPRAVVLSHAERRLFDEVLAARRDAQEQVRTPPIPG